MSDPELDAIRRARLAELRGNGMSMSSSGAMPVGQTPGMASGDDSGEKAAQVDEMKRQMLSQILDSEARERLSRIALVKPQKADAISDILLRMAQSGQVRQRVTEDQLILLLDQLDQASAHESGKITVTRKKTLDDEDDDWDL
ncbi:programmed cell death protein 5 [Malassezia restricta]|uniref:programmed cell death protein 5 n=1 Tax=Malassezia restricta TaxID=76775 RepID=UPI000DD13139|nr:programmed cell death protein 5 [Malassezia restricta]AXA49371.1 programmed cell death protein 5 [Malassezia restricta]